MAKFAGKLHRSTALVSGSSLRKMDKEGEYFTGKYLYRDTDENSKAYIELSKNRSRSTSRLQSVKQPFQEMARGGVASRARLVLKYWCKSRVDFYGSNNAVEAESEGNTRAVDGRG